MTDALNYKQSSQSGLLEPIYILNVIQFRQRIYIQR